MFYVKSCEFVNISSHIVKFLGVGWGTTDPYEVAGGWEGLFYPIREPVGLAPPWISTIYGFQGFKVSTGAKPNLKRKKIKPHRGPDPPPLLNKFLVTLLSLE